MDDLKKVYNTDLTDELYNLDNEEKGFFKAVTKIEDDEELKQHIIAVQTKAYAVGHSALLFTLTRLGIVPHIMSVLLTNIMTAHRYIGIRAYGYLSLQGKEIERAHLVVYALGVDVFALRALWRRLKISRLPAYPKLLELGRERNDPLFLDLGCCFGNDVRKAVQDGFPIKNVLASDLHADFWQLGHEMFRSTPESFPVPFIQGNVLEHSFLSPIPVFSEPSPFTSLVPDIRSPTLKSLNPLRSHISAIFCGAFFHLFDESDQSHIARSLACLLSPQPGSMIFGVHGSRKEGEKEKGFWHPSGSERWMFCHSVDSWAALWEEILGTRSRIMLWSGVLPDSKD